MEDERQSFATFLDGHTEEIFYFEFVSAGTVFVTKSGMYLQRTEYPLMGDNTCATEAFYSLHFDIMGSREDLVPTLKPEPIKSAQFDTRVKYSYTIAMGRTGKVGMVLIPPNSSEQEIRSIVLEDAFGPMQIVYEEVKE